MTEDTQKPEELITGFITIKGREYPYEEIKRLYGILGTQNRLAAVLNCTHVYVSHLKEQDPKFRMAIELGKDYADGQVINALFENCVKYKDTSAIKFYLGNKCKDEFAERSKVDLNVKSIDEVVNELSNSYAVPVEKITGDISCCQSGESHELPITGK